MGRGTTRIPPLPVSPTADASRSFGGYLPQLDGLRFVAIGLVLIHHAVTPREFGGYVGVDIFFVLSGYLITTIMLRELDRSRTIRLRSFYARRMLRLYPPLIAAVAVTIVPAVLVSKHVLYVAMDAGLAVTYLTPIGLQWNDGVSIVYRHTWSLGIEEMFYLAWPAVLIISAKLGKSRTVPFRIAFCGGTALLAGCIVQELPTGNLSYLVRAGGVLIGCALAISLWYRPRQVDAWIGWIGLAGLAMAVLVGASARLQGVAVAVAVLASVALVGSLVTNATGPLIKVVSAPPLAYLGRISYELYLWHYPVFVILSRREHTTFADVAWIALPVSFLLAATSHRMLTPWIARWKRNFSA